MKKNIFSIVALAAMVVLPMSVAAQTTTSATEQTAKLEINSHARIVSALALAKLTDLEFGSIFNTTGGTVTIGNSSDSKTTVTSGLTVIASASNPASFTVSGQSGAAYTLTIPTTVDLTAQDGLKTGKLTVTITPTKSGSTSLSEASETIYLGGSFPVTADQGVGDYAGTFEVTALYN